MESQSQLAALTAERHRLTAAIETVEANPVQVHLMTVKRDELDAVIAALTPPAARGSGGSEAPAPPPGEVPGGGQGLPEPEPDTPPSVPRRERSSRP